MSNFFISSWTVLAGFSTFIVCCILYKSGTRTPEEQRQEDDAQKAFLKANAQSCKK